MIAVILAAGGPKGSGRRNHLTWPVIGNRPKCLYSVDGKVQLARVMDDLTEAGATEFRIVAGYKHEMIKAFVERHDYDCEVVLNPNFYGPAIYSYQAGLKNLNDDALLCFADENIPVKYLKRLIAVERDMVVLQLANAHLPGSDIFRVSANRLHHFFDQRFLTKGYYDDLAKYFFIGDYVEPDISSGYSLGLIFLTVYKQILDDDPKYIATLDYERADYVKDIDRFDMTDEFKTNTLRFASPLYWLKKIGLGKILNDPGT